MVGHRVSLEACFGSLMGSVIGSVMGLVLGLVMGSVILPTPYNSKEALTATRVGKEHSGTIVVRAAKTQLT